jgi:hypothetical protein
MSDDNELTRVGRVTRVERTDSGVQIGQWYWMHTTTNDKVWHDRPQLKAGATKRRHAEPYDYASYTYKDVTHRSLLCVTDIGSNYVELTGSPHESQNYGRWHSWRVHFKDFASKCTLEPNAQHIIAGFVRQHRDNAQRLMEDVRTAMEKLGLTDQPAIGDGASELSGTSEALARSTGIEVKQYRADLELAKRVDIPHLFERIKWENKVQAQWMKAEMLSFKSQAGKLKPIEEAIEARLLNVELYAGLVEQVEQLREGAPAARDEPVRLMQRLHYMDEECLAHYEAGGMDYRSIDDFDRWLAKDEHFTRVLPFPRCVVSFRVRRDDKQRHCKVPSDFIKIAAEKEADKKTYLYLRNGDRLYRLSTEHDFGAQLFPDFDTTEPSQSQLYYRQHWSQWEIISAERLQGMREDEAADERAARARFEADRAACLAKGEKWSYGKTWSDGNIFYSVDRDSKDFAPLNTDTVYHDDVMAEMQRQIRAHNRVAMVLQGLMDRSEVFHPHPRWHLWSESGFAAAVRLVYDDSRTLVAGARPDFEAYRRRLNASLKKGSMVTGQIAPWLEHERVKEYERRRSNWRLSYEERQVKEWWTPPYDGPDLVHRAESVGLRGVLFKWTRERMSRRRRYSSRDSDDVVATFTAPVNTVLNVSAYTPGDFKQFYADPRTRADYLQWAPLLLAAEDWHAQHKKKEQKS